MSARGRGASAYPKAASTGDSAPNHRCLERGRNLRTSPLPHRVVARGKKREEPRLPCVVTRQYTPKDESFSVYGVGLCDERGVGSACPLPENGGAKRPILIIILFQATCHSNGPVDRPARPHPNQVEVGA